MEALINITLSFFEGFILILSPCIWPILPLIISGSINGSKSKPIGIVLGFILSFSIFTFFSRKLIQLFSIDLTVIRNISLSLLFIFGLIMVFDFLNKKFEWLALHFINMNVTPKNYSKFELINGIALGCLIGLIWTPCAGPILAAVILQTILQKTDVASFFIIVAFSFGIGIPIFIFALLGNRILAKIKFLKKYSSLIRKILGMVIMASVIFILYGTIPMTVNESTKNIMQKRLIHGLLIPYKAEELQNISSWLNTSVPLKISSLKNQVILIDFWAYSCINCIRTIPYLNEWYNKYKDKNFIIIGVHSPEFAFESKLSNVKKAIEKYNIKYPVALDNNFATWRAYNNHYWPAHYLIDQSGNIVYQHFGEGDYDITENNIRFLLGLNKDKPIKLPSFEHNTLSTNKSLNYSQNLTPETYLGLKRENSNVNKNPNLQSVLLYYFFPSNLFKNEWALQNFWLAKPDKIISKASNAKIRIKFSAQNVYAVMGNSNGKPIKITIKFYPTNTNDLTIKFKQIMVDKHDLYQLINLPMYQSGILEIASESEGLEIFTFTFG